MDLNIPIGTKVPLPFSWKKAVEDENPQAVRFTESELILPDQNTKNTALGDECSPSNVSARKKACKNCTCGLAEEISSEIRSTPSVEVPKGGCGSVHMG